MFLFSTLCFYQADYIRITENHREIQKKILIILAILAPCLLAAFRGVTVGTDAGGYPVRYLESAIQAGSWGEYVDLYTERENMLYHASSVEFSFRLICYIVARTFPDIRVLYFVLQFIVVYSVYKGLKAYKVNHIWLGMLVYLCIFYSYSLNCIRQSMACGILFYGTHYIIKKDLKKFLIFIGIAIFFHYSAIFYVVLYPIGILIGNAAEKNHYTAIRNIVFIVLGVLAMCLMLNVTVYILQQILSGTRFLSYLNFNFIIRMTSIIRRMPMIAIMLFFFRNIVWRDKSFYFIFCVLIIELISSQISQLQLGLEIAYRYFLYIFYFYIVAIPKVTDSIGGAKNRRIISLIIIGYLFFFWYYSFIYTGGQGVYPYVFNF